MTWRESFEIYKSELFSSTKELINDKQWFFEREKFHPNLDVKLTIEKAYKDFWATEKGWKNKKASKSESIDWKATFNNALTQKVNQVYNQSYGKTEKQTDHVY